jgi:hypothetical protein
MGRILSGLKMLASVLLASFRLFRPTMALDPWMIPCIRWHPLALHEEAIVMEKLLVSIPDAGKALSLGRTSPSTN